MALKSIRFTAQQVMMTVRRLARPPDVVLTDYTYTDVLSGESTSVTDVELPIGLDNAFEPRRWYRNILGLTYKCEWVNGDTAQLFLIHRQHGQDNAVRFTVDTGFAPRYVEITDAGEITRLESEYLRYPSATDEIDGS